MIVQTRTEYDVCFNAMPLPQIKGEVSSTYSTYLIYLKYKLTKPIVIEFNGEEI